MPKGGGATVGPLKYIFEDTLFFKIIDFFLEKGNDSYYGAPLIGNHIGKDAHSVRRFLNMLEDERGIIISHQDGGKKYKLSAKYFRFLTDFQTWYKKKER